MEADFSGYATKAGLKCSDGRTIMPGAFKHQDKMRVPLVWQHGHSDPENVLGHAILENRDDGVYAFGFFNESARATHTKGLLEHGDINMMSIWANELVERSGRVLHGAIREVSLVLSGANPGALIENVTIRHSDGDEDILDDEAIIFTGLELELQHAEETKVEEVVHADAPVKTDAAANADLTIQDVYDSMTPEQQEVLHYMVGEALSSSGNDNVQQDNLQQDNINDQEGTKMTRNVFESDEKDVKPVLSHADIEGIVADATKSGSLKQAVEDYALAHGINDIDVLFPEATQLTAAPEFFARRMEWVNGVLSGARKTPFSRIKTATADLTFEEARAKGYIKGNLKKEEFFGTSRRVTTPQTIYKKQKLDRDDIIDITDFDVVAWMKGEMRVMLDEEIGRAILIGDGREPGGDDKINETNIRPIAKDDDFYTISVNVNIDDASSSISEVVDAIIMNRQYMRGSGQPTMYTTEGIIAQFLLLKDTLGRRIYQSLDQVAAELRVSAIVPVEVLSDEPTIVAILVNMNDYVIGADKGGQVALFDDFDIDYNQYKYLMETRISGALVRPKAAMVVMKTASTDTLLTPAVAPTFDPETGVITLPTSTHYAWKDGAGAALTDGAQTALDVGESLTVVAVADSGYFFASSENDEWTFTRTA
jgi:hypothetical protein